MHLKSKWLKESNDFLLAEIFLNTRNFLIITNALLNPNVDNTTIALGPYLTALLEVLEDPVKLRNGIVLLKEVSFILLIVYGITYKWIHIPVENPVAKIGAGLGVAFALLVCKIFNFPFWEKVELYLACMLIGGLIGSGVYDWPLGPRVFQERNDQLFQRIQQYLLDGFQAVQPNREDRQEFNAQADRGGNVGLY